MTGRDCRKAGVRWRPSLLQVLGLAVPSRAVVGSSNDPDRVGREVPRAFLVGSHAGVSQ